MNVQVRVEVVAVEPVTAVVLGRRVRPPSFRQTAIEDLQRVRNAVAAAHVPTAGAPFVRYVSLGRRPSVEFGLPLDGPHVVPTLRMTILPGGPAASLWHTGPHETLLDSLEDLGRWVDENARSGGDPWHWYWTEPDADDLRIQILWPLR